MLHFFAKSRARVTLKLVPKKSVLRIDNMNDNRKNNILMSENIKQKRLTILEYFDAYIYHHYQPKIIQ